MAQEGNAIFQEVFVMASPAKSIKLLPWSISSAVPSHYISEALATATQQGKNAPAITVAHEPEKSPTPDSLSSAAHLTGTHCPLTPFLPNLPFVGTPWWGIHLLSF